MSPPGWFEIHHHVDRRRDIEGVDIEFGAGRVRQLGEVLDDKGLARALVVCGQNVARNASLLDPVRDALGDRLVGIFAGSSPNKELATVFDGIAQMRHLGVDLVIGVGGGSSLDTARQMSVFASDGGSLADFRQAAFDGRLTAPVRRPGATGVMLVPTTLAGADLSSGGTIEVLSASESPTGQPVRTCGVITPMTILYDPELVGTTPPGALCNSAMNGFDKGVETIYSPLASPFSDACSIQGLRLMARGLPGLRDGDPVAVGDALAGVILVQLRRHPSIIHAFGHGVSRHSDIQQGIGHAILAPHALRHVFAHSHARRDLLAAALGIDASGDEADIAERIVAHVTAVRDRLGVPTRFRDVDPSGSLDLSAIARYVAGDRLMQHSPAPLDAAEAEVILHGAR